MSYDESRVRELQTALRTKMAENKTIADSFKVEDGTVIVSTEQKSAFDTNMRDIREIRGLIDGLEQMKDAESWGREEGSSVAVEYNAKSAESAMHAAAREFGFKSIGEMFVNSPEFKSLRAKAEQHPIEAVGRDLRKLMSWVKTGDNDYVEGTAGR